jgi:hypothetical protein
LPCGVQLISDLIQALLGFLAPALVRQLLVYFVPQAGKGFLLPPSFQLVIDL